MAASGGNKKTASQSDKNYWQRAKASGYATTHKDRKIARHVGKIMRRLKLTSPAKRQEMINSFGGTPDFPKLAQKRPLEKVVDRSNITEGVRLMHVGFEGDERRKPFPGAPLYQGYSAGVLLEQGFSLSSVNSVLDGSPQERHVYIQHPTGRRELLSFTPCK